MRWLIVGRPKKKDRLPPRPYNLTIETSDHLDKLKRKGENQNDTVKRVLFEYEQAHLTKEELSDLKSVYEDNLGTLRAVREKFNKSCKIIELMQNIILGGYTLLP